MAIPFACLWDHHGRADFQGHTVKELLEHLLENDRTIIEKENRIMTDLSNIQDDEAALTAAQSQEATDVLKALDDLEAKINSGTGVTAADLQALRGPLQAALASAQSTDAAAVAADATLNPPAPAPGA